MDSHGSLRNCKKGSIPYRPTGGSPHSSVEPERLTTDQKVAGSNPAGDTGGLYGKKERSAMSPWTFFHGSMSVFRMQTRSFP